MLLAQGGLELLRDVAPRAAVDREMVPLAGFVATEIDHTLESSVLARVETAVTVCSSCHVVSPPR